MVDIAYVGPTIDLASRLGTQLAAVFLQSPMLSVLRTLIKMKFTWKLDMFASVDKVHIRIL